MPVEVQQETLTPCRVALDVTVPPEQYKETVDRVFHQMAKRTQVPGFRPGKAPRRLIERFIDQDRVNEIALERVVAEGYTEALQQTGLNPFDDPDLKVEEIEEGKPVTFRVTIPLAPKVELGEYRGLTFRRMETAILDTDVEAELDRLRQEAARHEDVDEPGKEGDRVLATVQMTVDGQAIEGAGLTSPSWLLIGGNLPEFDAGLTGISANEDKVFNFTYPDDFAVEERRGKTAEAHVHALKVQRRVVPDLDDSFAEGLGHTNLEEAKAAAREALQARAAELADGELSRDILQEIVARSAIHFPDEMLTREVADDLGAFVKRLQRNGLTLQGYLNAKEMELHDLEAEYSEHARRRITNSLAMLRIAEENEIRVEDVDVDAEIERRAEASGADPSVVRRVLEDQDELEALRSTLFYRKVTDFLKSVNTIEEKKG